MIKKLLSISVASLALVACSDNGDDFALNSYGSDSNCLELQDASNIASSREIRKPNLASQYYLTAFASSSSEITGSFKAPASASNGTLVLYRYGSVVARKPISSCMLLKPDPDAEELPTIIGGCYSFRCSASGDGSYTVSFEVNGEIMQTAVVEASSTPNPGGGGGLKPLPLLPVDGDIIP